MAVIRSPFLKYSVSKVFPTVTFPGVGGVVSISRGREVTSVFKPTPFVTASIMKTTVPEVSDLDR